MTGTEELLLPESRACASRFFLAIGRKAREKWRDEMSGELFGITEYLRCEGMLRAGSPWRRRHRFHPDGVALADRHYNRRKVGSAQFVPPGSCLVLVSECRRAVWVTSWPKAAYVRHAWPGAWVNSLFRREGGPRASDLIRAAVAHTRAFYGDPPSLGMVSFVDPKHIKPTMVRGNPMYGYCYLKAGFKHVGFTKGGLWAWQMLPHEMPAPEGCEGMLADERATIVPLPVDHAELEYLSRCEAAIRRAAEEMRA